MFQTLAPRALAVIAAVLLTACGGSAVETGTVAAIQPTLQPAVQAYNDPVPTPAERAAQEAYLLAYEQARSIELNRQTQENQARSRMLAYQEASSAQVSCGSHEPSCADAPETAVN